ncbi:hypothetical protein GXP67_27785 [Rhodocytophaga rosea]|uniref:Zinc finger CHC2-type domain-containing protein n=1 Tax=Rhodocytophaga rosea TaxID=2704465 RepID=A0A6C0GQ34_9BACT|nr:CHC2 zinc finger domain-containing protein [Rhodocytophaga rosea]QHT70176.1 hypothetical protein GXP67_27785 [Rhodocytophaga rosea]
MRKSINKDLINRIKQVPIISYLNSIGIQPQKTSGDQLIYYSPFQPENSPSFYVHPQKNVFNDFSTDIRGDVIRLVRLLHQCSFSEAIEILDNGSLHEKLPSVSFSNDDLKKSSVEIVSVKNLTSTTLLNYLQSRKISLGIASAYLKEIDFTINDRPFFALGFKNSKGGYELRNKGFKGSASPKYSTLIPVPGSATINVFEGFMDFLSALEYYKMDSPTHTTLILNSLSFLDEALIELLCYQRVNAFLDNDFSGNKAFKKLMDAHPNVIDHSYIYLGYDDFNEYWSSISQVR